MSISIQPDDSLPSILIPFIPTLRSSSSIELTMALVCGLDPLVRIIKKSAREEIFWISRTVISSAFLFEAASTIISANSRESSFFGFAVLIIKNTPF